MFTSIKHKEHHMRWEEKYFRNLEPVTVSIDDSPSFEGMADPNDQWNGWVMPLFTVDVAKAICAAFFADATLNTYEFKDGYVVVTYGGMSEEDVDEFHFVERDGQTWVPLGAGSWCWWNDAWRGEEA
jgi:hypothetical protein